MLREIVDVRTGLTANLQKIAKSARGDEARRRAFSFEKRVGGDSRAQSDEAYFFGLALGLFQDLANPADRCLMRIVGCRREFMVERIAATIIDHEQVGERPADIDSDAQGSGHRLMGRVRRS